MPLKIEVKDYADAHVHYFVYAEDGHEVKQVDRDLTEAEKRRLKVRKQSLADVILWTESGKK